MGVQVCPLPTAVLSTHSGGFGEMSFVDLTDAMAAHAAHWRALGLRFNAVYSGFLGSARQIELVAAFIDDFRNEPGQLAVVDPVMADNGMLYRTYTAEMRERMGELAAKADLLTPNLTEAYFLLGEPYDNAPMRPEAIRDLLKRLTDLGPSAVVVKSVRTSDGGYANAALDRRVGELWMRPFRRLPVDYPGTGDTFGAVLLGSLLAGADLAQSVDAATSFLSHAVGLTLAAGTDPRHGTLLETALPLLCGRKVDDDEHETADR